MVTNRIFLGSTAEYAVRVAGVGDILATTEHHAALQSDLIEPGEQVALTFEPGSALLFPPRSPNPGPGGTVEEGRT